MGMHNLYLRQKLLASVEQYASMQEQLAARYTQTNGNSGAYPSAPPQENIPSAPPAASTASSAPSAPPIETFQSTECCVCMERKVKIHQSQLCLSDSIILRVLYTLSIIIILFLVWYHLLTLWTRLLLYSVREQQRKSFTKLPSVPYRYFPKGSLELNGHEEGQPNKRIKLQHICSNKTSQDDVLPILPMNMSMRRTSMYIRIIWIIHYKNYNWNLQKEQSLDPKIKSLSFIRFVKWVGALWKWRQIISAR